MKAWHFSKVYYTNKENVVLKIASDTTRSPGPNNVRWAFHWLHKMWINIVSWWWCCHSFHGAHLMHPLHVRLGLRPMQMQYATWSLWMLFEWIQEINQSIDRNYRTENSCDACNLHVWHTLWCCVPLGIMPHCGLWSGMRTMRSGVA